MINENDPSNVPLTLPELAQQLDTCARLGMPYVLSATLCKKLHHAMTTGESLDATTASASGESSLGPQRWSKEAEMMESWLRPAPASGQQATVEAVGEIIANDPVHGWHMNAFKPWNEIGEGTLLYAGLPPRVTQSMVDTQNKIIDQLEASNSRLDTLRAKYGIPAATTGSANRAPFENPGHKDCYCGGWTDDTGDFHNLGCPELAPQAASTASASGDADCHDSCGYIGAECDFPACKVRAPTSSRAPAPRYTCIGKGGEYELIGVAYGAGTSRGTTVNLYRDAMTGVIYFRTPEDFAQRMERIEPD